MTVDINMYVSVLTGGISIYIVLMKLHDCE